MKGMSMIADKICKLVAIAGIGLLPICLCVLDLANREELALRPHPLSMK